MDASVNKHVLVKEGLLRIGSDMDKSYTIFGTYECEKCKRIIRINRKEEYGVVTEILNDANDIECVVDK